MQIVLTENCTVDGVIDMDAGWFDPAEQADDDRLVAALQAQMGEEHAVLLGRRTFESFRSYWPHQTDDTTGITDHLNRVQKYVLSTTLQDPGWEHTTILRDFDEMQALKDRAERLDVTGSISVAQRSWPQTWSTSTASSSIPCSSGPGPASWPTPGASTSTSSRRHRSRRASPCSATSAGAEPVLRPHRSRSR